MKTFSVHPCGYLVDVTLHDCADDLRAAVKEQYGADNPQGGAFTIIDDKGVAHVHFAADIVLMDFVTHEAVHVALGIASAMQRLTGNAKWDNTEDCEEDVAEIAGEFARLFWNQLFGFDDTYHIAANRALIEGSFTAIAGETREI